MDFPSLLVHVLLSLGERPRLPFTARIERAQFHRARSASKKGTWSLPPAGGLFQHPATHPVADNATSGQTQPSHPTPPDAGPAQDH